MLTFLTLIPIIALLLCLIVFKIHVAKSGAVALGFALIIAVVFFGITRVGIMNASGKAFWLALFVLLIVWCALFLYHLVNGFGAIEVINRSIAGFVQDKFIVYLLLAWLFSGLLQGIAGFGIPSVIVAPILISLGFKPLKALTAVVLGHCWAVTFGSMASAFFVIQGITKLPPEGLGLPMWLFNIATIFLTGIGVCSLYDEENIRSRAKGVLRGLPYLLPITLVMVAVQYLTIRLRMYSLGTVNAALAGVITMFLLYKVRSSEGKVAKLLKLFAVKSYGESISESVKPIEEKSAFQSENSTLRTPNPKLSLLQSVFPYALILVLLLSFQFIPMEVRNNVALFPKFAETMTRQTSFGNTVRIIDAETRYTPIKLFVHPAMVLLIASGAACIIYKKRGIWDSGVFKNAVKQTVKKGIPATLALLAFGHMSLIMMDSGMMLTLAESVANLTGELYPLFAPYIGVLASFLTGNNTNSNVMFGDFQFEVAKQLNLNGAVMTAAQSIGAGLGCSIASTLVFMAALATKQPENVPVVLKKLIPIVLIIAGIMGIINYVFINSI